MSTDNMHADGPGKISSKKGNPYRGDRRALFLGPETDEEKARKARAEQWDLEHPNGVEE